MKIAITGLPQCGRSMVWRYLSSGHIGHETLSTVPVPDARLEDIARFSNSKRIKHFELELDDTIGDIIKGGSIYSQLQGSDGVIIVVRGFDRGFGNPEPVVDAKRVKDAFILFDSNAIKTRSTTLERAIKKGHSREEKQLMEKELLELSKFVSVLESQQPINSLELSEDELKFTRNQGLITAKFWLALLNCEELFSESILDKISSCLQCKVVQVAVGLESELEELNTEDAVVFRRELGLPEQNSREMVLKSLIDSMNLITFFTSNRNESHAWCIQGGTNALMAAGKIHTDMQRGFIRAEVIRWDKFVEAGGYENARSQSLFRAEGKDYIIQDGDYIKFRFNI